MSEVSVNVVTEHSAGLTWVSFQIQVHKIAAQLSHTAIDRFIFLLNSHVQRRIQHNPFGRSLTEKLGAVVECAHGRYNFSRKIFKI